MKLILTLLARDEVDIIKSMLDFHFACGIDHIIVTDNGSIDGTLEILKDYEKKGKIELLIEPASDFSQHRWVSKMANIAYDKYHADWVFHADADELFLPAQHYQSLKEYLKQIPESISILNVPRHDFIPFERPMKESPHVEMIYRKVVSHNLVGKPLTPKVVHRGSANVVVSQGNHLVTGDNLNEFVLAEELSIYHYPIRTYKQFITKVDNGGSGYAKNNELGPGIGFHKRYWYYLLLNNKLSEVYYDELFYNSEKLEASLERHEVIKDYSIADYFNKKTNLKDN